MSTYTATAEYTGYLIARASAFDDARDQSSADGISDSAATIKVGQYKRTGPGWTAYWLFRCALEFDLSELPETADITAVTLRLYGVTDGSTDDFDVTVVAGIFGTPLTYTDYNDFYILDLGHISTADCVTAGWNEITLNADGIAEIRDQFESGSTILLGLRNDNDISGTAPSNDEYFTFDSWNASNPPQLVITYSNWPHARHPDAPCFPADGYASPHVQAVVQAYMEDLTDIMRAISDNAGNIDLDADKGIEFDGTEKISWDNANSRVVFDDFKIDTSLTLVNLYVETAIVEDGGQIDIVAANAEVGTYADFSAGGVYAAIKSKVADNELTFSTTSAPSPGDGTGVIFYNTVSNALSISINPTGAPGTATGVIGDWDLM